MTLGRRPDGIALTGMMHLVDVRKRRPVIVAAPDRLRATEILAGKLRPTAEVQVPQCGAGKPTLG